MNTWLCNNVLKAGRPNCKNCSSTTIET